MQTSPASRYILSLVSKSAPPSEAYIADGELRVPKLQIIQEITNFAEIYD
jgi:hypothetical protein